MFDFIQRQTKQYQKQGKRLKIASQLMQLQHPAGRVKFYGIRVKHIEFEINMLLLQRAFRSGVPTKSMNQHEKELATNLVSARRQLADAQYQIYRYGNNRVQN